MAVQLCGTIGPQLIFQSATRQHLKAQWPDELSQQVIKNTATKRDIRYYPQVTRQTGFLLFVLVIEKLEGTAQVVYNYTLWHGLKREISITGKIGTSVIHASYKFESPYSGNFVCGFAINRSDTIHI